MLRLYSTTVFLFLSTIVLAQPVDRFTDSLKKKLASATTDYDRMTTLASLAMASFADHELAEKYMGQAVEVAELSRDRRLMAMIYLAKGNRYMNAPGLSDNLDRAITNFHRGEEISKANNLSALLVMNYKKLATAMQMKGDAQKAMFYSNQALSTGSNSENDTARVEGYLAMGGTYLQMNEKLLSFRNFLQALNAAEKSGDESLLKETYGYLSDFYASIKAYDTAIDYRMRVYEMNKKKWDINQIISGDYEIGDLYWKNKQQDMALRMYEHAIQLADTLHYELFKWDPYFRIFNMYFNNEQFVKAKNYLWAHA
ncbi:MAG: hypothetical protein JST68_18055, partial [Bacteroidetes bacterium]|nr:hypothetical protein [Bacteroidota bacterium]